MARKGVHDKRPYQFAQGIGVVWKSWHVHSLSWAYHYYTIPII